jgi:hypothetical protein
VISKITVDCVKVSRAMVSVIHCDDDTKEAT